MLWCCRDLAKLDDGDSIGLDGSLTPAGKTRNFRPLGDVAFAEIGDAAVGVTFPAFDVLGVSKVTSGTPNFGNVGLS